MEIRHQYTYFRSTSSTCPICNGTENNCHYSELNYIHCRKEAIVEGYRRLKQNEISFWVYQPLSSISMSFTPSFREERELDVLPTEVHSRRLCEFVQTQELSQEYKNELYRRGILNKIMFSRISDRLVTVQSGMICPEIAGSKEGRWASSTGMFILCKDVEGNYLPGQIYRKGGTPKYLWTNEHEIDKYNKFDELPLQWACANDNPALIVLCEGTLKPLIAAARNPLLGFLGASGGNFQYNTTVDHLKTLSRKYNKTEFYLAPDSGSFLNDNVLHQYKKVRDIVLSLGYKLHILDWGQLRDKSAGDVDEINLTEQLKCVL
jgi:hypothetical protein